MKIKYGLIALATIPDEDGLNDILHFCGYEKEPQSHDIESLKTELQTDPEFGLVGRDDYIVLKAPDTIVDLYKERFLRND